MVAEVGQGRVWVEWDGAEQKKSMPSTGSWEGNGSHFIHSIRSILLLKRQTALC